MKNTEKTKITLSVLKREVFGKKLKKLRKEKLVPGNIFGRDIKSQAISFYLKDFIKVYKIAKETGIVYLLLEKKEIPVLIKNLQKDPVKGHLLHVDFRKVDLKEKIETEVPIKIVGVSQAVEEKGGVLLEQSDRLSIEALPEEIPQEIIVDISVLQEVGQEIKVKDLKIQGDYTIKTDPEKVIVSVVAHKEENLTPETETSAPEVITEQKDEEQKENEQNEKVQDEKQENKS